MCFKQTSYQRILRLRHQKMLFKLLTTLLLTTPVTADYECLCCYGAEKTVLDKPSTDGQTLGYMYEFDCKKLYPVAGLSSQYVAVEFEHKIGYVHTDQDVQKQNCKGDPPSADTADTRNWADKVRYLGVGYDLFHGNPGGMERTLDGNDPGMLLKRRIFQVTGNVEKNSTSCVYNKKNQYVYNGKSYQKELSSYLVFLNKSMFGMDSDAFTLNREFAETRQKTEGDDGVIYSDVITSCQLGTLRYKDDPSISVNSISLEFAADVCNMSEVFDASQYFRFIDHWGTSIIMGTKLGTLGVERYKTTGLHLFQKLQSSQQLEKVLHPSGPYKGYGSSVTLNLTYLPASGVTNTLGGVLDMNVAVGSTSDPAPIELTLQPLSEALNPKYWTEFLVGDDFDEICSHINTTFLQTIARNLELAFTKYYHFRQQTNMKPSSNQNLQIPLNWPDGSYGLPGSRSGCPNGKVTWDTGHRLHDTEDSDPHNYFTPNIQQYLSGSFAADNIAVTFCIKTAVTTDINYVRDWPKGSYCVYRYGDCPKGFQEGFIIWDDDDGGLFDSNNNRQVGVLPTGKYGDNTEINYCCRDDAPPTRKMYMPREVPFVLMRYKQACQEVHDMAVHELFVRWDDEDNNNRDAVGGAHPFDAGGRHDHLLYFCYSRKSSMVLVLQSLVNPFPHRYAFSSTCKQSR